MRSFRAHLCHTPTPAMLEAKMLALQRELEKVKRGQSAGTAAPAQQPPQKRAKVQVSAAS